MHQLPSRASVSYRLACRESEPEHAVACPHLAVPSSDVISSSDLVSLLVLGVLLPSSLVRPAFLRDRGMSSQARNRWNYGYSMFAFAMLGFVDIAALRLLRPSTPLSPSARGALTGAAVFVILIVAAVHLPPIVRPRQRLLPRFVLAASAVLCGLCFGGFVAVDLVYPTRDTPLIAVVSGTVLLAAAGTSTLWFSGLSPDTRHAIYRRRRSRRGHRERA